MKIRTSFVTNSSSSSFLVRCGAKDAYRIAHPEQFMWEWYFNRLDDQSIKEMHNIIDYNDYAEIKNEFEDFFGDVRESKGWRVNILTTHGKVVGISGGTCMDNFDYGEWVEYCKSMSDNPKSFHNEYGEDFGPEIPEGCEGESV